MKQNYIVQLDITKLNKNLINLKDALNLVTLSSLDSPFYQSFESDEVASTGVMPLPAKDEKLLGGHAVAAVGFDDNKKCMIVRNSWGEDWGDNGYFYMPYKFIINPAFCSDFWVVEKVADLQPKNEDSQQQNKEPEQDNDNNQTQVENHNEKINENTDEEFELDKEGFDSNNHETINYVI